LALRAADVLLHGGKVITVDPRFSIAQAVAVSANRIAFVGSDADARGYVGTDTRVIDLHGRAVMPGLIDGHAHMDREGLKRVFPTLEHARSVADVKDAIAELARRTPRGEWIVTMPLGAPPYYREVPECYAEGRLPTRADLDAAAPHHPVYIRPIWGFWRHTTPLVSIANSRALALAGVTKHTAAPVDSVVIDKDATTGEPTGIFYDHTLMSVVEMTLMRAATGFTLADRTSTLPDAMRDYHAFGTTSVFEEHGVAGELLRAYKLVHERGEMSMRATLVMSPNWVALPVEDFEPVIEAWASWLAGHGFGDDFLRVSGIFVDIGPSAEDALRSKLGSYTGWAGFNYATGLSRERVKKLCLACAKYRIRVVAIWPNMLEVFDEVNREIDITGMRWVLGHLSTLTPEQVAKVRELGLVVTSHTNRYVYKEGHLLKKKLGAERENEIAPLRSLVDAGVHLSLATDNVPPSLFYPLWQSICRRNLYTGEAIAPAQALTREQALRSATIEGAYVTWEEARKGSIEVGKLADLAVLSADPLTAPDDALKDIVAELTLVDGRVVYERSTERQSA
jgi:predicted amidohydrolase YtcJ